MRGIDHLVLLVNDLDRASALYQTLGFTVTPKNIHPFGTANRLVQLEGSFLELVAINDPSSIPAMEGTRFSFAEFCRRRLEAGEGGAMLALQSDDAWRDLAGFQRSGLTSYESFEFSRHANFPDGTSAGVGFKLGFLPDPEMPEIMLFVCQHLSPQHFWRHEFQTHGNGAVVIRDVALVSNDPASHMTVYDGFLGGRGIEGAHRLDYPAPRGRISIITPKVFEDEYGALPASCGLQGFTIGVDRLDVVESTLKRSAISAKHHNFGLLVDPSQTFGVHVRFEEMRSTL